MTKELIAKLIYRELELRAERQYKKGLTAETLVTLREMQRMEDEGLIKSYKVGVESPPGT